MPTLTRPRSVALLEVAAIVAVVSQAALLIVVAPAQWWLGFALIVAATLVVLGAVRPALLVSVAVLVRPLLDGLSQSVVGGQSGANPAGMLGLLLVVTLVVYAVVNRHVFQPSATRVWVVVLLVSCLSALNGVAGLDGALGLKPIGEVVRIVALFAVYLLTANLFALQERCERLFVLVGLSAVLPALDGLYDLWITGPDHAEGVSTETIGRIGGTFSGPIPFSTYLAITGLTLVFLPKERLSAWIRFPALTVIMTALVGTYTREGWIVFMLGLTILAWRQHKRVLLVAFVVVAVLVASIPTVGDRVLPSRGNSDRGKTFESYDWRIDTWNTLLKKWANDSPVVGFGLKSVPEVNPRKLRVEGQAPRGFDAHNSVVKLLVEGGVLLLAAYIAFFVVLLRTSRRLARAKWPLQPYARIVFVLWTAAAVVGVFTDDILSATASLFAVLALTGALEGAYRHWLSNGGDDDEPPAPEVAPQPDTGDTGGHVVSRPAVPVG